MIFASASLAGSWTVDVCDSDVNELLPPAATFSVTVAYVRAAAKEGRRAARDDDVASRDAVRRADMVFIVSVLVSGASFQSC